jgi:hypothetical protein
LKKESELALRMRQAVNLRRSEKKILLKCLKMVKNAHKQVQDGWDERSMDIVGPANIRSLVSEGEIIL